MERLLNAECVESYRRGGFHPVDIGDIFQNRYIISRKLGHGSSSTVWLAQDIRDNRYVAIKIKSSTASKASKESVIHRRISANKATRDHVVTLLDDFTHNGPNGEHECLVFEPMGPNVAACFERSIPYWQGKSIVQQLLAALQCLHDMGIAHSDTNPGNLLLSLTREIKDLSVGGNCMSMQIASKRNLGAPQRIYEDWPLTEFWDKRAPAELKLSDFGAAFQFDKPPSSPIIAVALRAPEVVLQLSFDHKIDIWSFACYLFEVFTGQPLFELPPFYPPQTDLPRTTVKDDCHIQQTAMKDDDHLLQMINTLGPLPSRMFEAWPRRMTYFDKGLTLTRTDVKKPDDSLSAICPGETLEQRVQDSQPTGMTANEVAGLVHALKSALQYDPSKRPSATDLLRLDWFNCTKALQAG